MFRTDERTLLVDLLTPPEGYRIERAVGTPFTMQMEALLRVPLAVLGAEWRAGADPLGVMEAVRAPADRLDGFCPAGMLAGAAQPPLRASRRKRQNLVPMSAHGRPPTAKERTARRATRP